ncbi:MAG: hypothetical protein ABSD85_10990 [Acidimicrobiales bacterium]|jgi:hypothetical protein
MKRHSTKAIVIALTAAASMLFISASSVQAQPLQAGSSTKFQKAQQALEHQIIARQVQLALLGTEVANAANVTSTDRTALSTIITNEQSGLATDATNAAGATTYAELNTVHQAMIGDERVYVVVTAQVNLVLAADNDTVTEAGYTGLATELASLVSELNSNHATHLLSDITSRVTAATSLTTGLSGEALALTPAGYPGNESQIKTYNFQLNQVARDLGIAKGDVKAIEDIALGIRVFHFGKLVATTNLTKFQQAQQALEHQIVARQVQLVLLGTELADAANVTSADRTALATIITNEQNALGTDATNAAAATTFAELNKVRQAVIGDERVYAVVTAQVNLVIGADDDAVIETGYTGLATELAPLVTELDSNHASHLLSDITSRVSAATSLTTGLSADALALTPAGYPGNESQINTYKFQLGQVGRDLSIARTDVKAIEDIALGVHWLHYVKPVSTTTTTTS